MRHPGLERLRAELDEVVGEEPRADHCRAGFLVRDQGSLSLNPCSMTSAGGQGADRDSGWRCRRVIASGRSTQSHRRTPAVRTASIRTSVSARETVRILPRRWWAPLHRHGLRLYEMKIGSRACSPDQDPASRRVRGPRATRVTIAPAVGCRGVRTLDMRTVEVEVECAPTTVPHPPPSRRRCVGSPRGRVEEGGQHAIHRGDDVRFAWRSFMNRSRSTLERATSGEEEAA